MRYELNTKSKSLKFTTWDNMMALSHKLIKHNVEHTVTDHRFKVTSKIGGNKDVSYDKSSRWEINI